MGRRYVSREVTITSKGCDFTFSVEIQVEGIAGIIGEDTTMTYCISGGPVDVKKALSLDDHLSYYMDPVLSDGNLIFNPAIDTDGQYLLIAVSSEGCKDTINVKIEKSQVQAIVLEPIRLCSGAEKKIGLKPDFYDEVKWWNGEVGDSTTLSGVSTGYYKVTAEKDGCTYRGEFKLSITPGVEFSDGFPDRVQICEGENYSVVVYGMDSLVWNNQVFLQGDTLVFDQDGTEILMGYNNGCEASKSTSVEKIVNPEDEFSRVYERCADQSITLQLPNDTLGWTFGWEDTVKTRQRTVNDIGPYYFTISSDQCTYQGAYSGLLKDNCGDCEISIPNAVTPNGDGINDGLKIFSGCSFKILSIELFDKWGGRLYQTSHFEITSQVWVDLPPDVYVVQVSFEEHDGVHQTAMGNVQVIK